MLTVRDVIADPRTTGVTPAAMDDEHLNLLREFIKKFMDESAKAFPAKRQEALLLDIAPQDHSGAVAFEQNGYTRETADIDPNSGATYIADITKCNSAVLPDNKFDAVVCTEVLEHTEQPFLAIKELCRVLRPGGSLFLSVPCNFRIHGPLPDGWRFTEHGVRHLCQSSGLKIIRFWALETPGRPLFPIDYAVVAEKPM
jgi:SAM-dependent methyltransferase